MCLWGGNETALERTAWVNGEFLWVSFSASDSVMRLWEVQIGLCTLRGGQREQLCTEFPVL